MTRHLTEEEVLAAIPALTRPRLVAFIEAGMVIPLRRKGGGGTQGAAATVFRRVDFARVQLLCELADDLELDEAALGVVIALIDQLHATRQDLLAVARAMDSEPPEVRARIGSAILRWRD